ncbi:MAG: hypothetical protein NAG76_22330 [Candidatus Pristimantibacillus lignocellulolyticus]|uniref:Uncharacterized protein n=1 Tax=Candidatus Pristimantibacillus lignocellulolyticus TaxID=2994561 RepID=A0A9J6ZF70_9BACL|nr:MAG: hypothetical protein NAG76_22330 [Candidatus Pristimantibacillus lignocellulolyticus]
MAGGAFQTSRELFNNPIWQNIVEFRLFFLIYGNAIFSEEGHRVDDTLTLHRGQWLRSTRKIQEDLQFIDNRQVKTYSTATINRTIQRLVKLQRVCTKTHELGTVFTVLNYEQYQGFGHYKKDELGTQLGTETKQRRNNNKNVYEGDEGKKKKPSPSHNKKRIYSEDESCYKAAAYLKEKIRGGMQEVGKEHLMDNINLQTWANDFRLMFEKDNVDKVELYNVINWCTSDAFWKTNILSANKLREKYKELVIKSAQRPRQSKGSGKNSKVNDNMDFFLQGLGGSQSDARTTVSDTGQGIITMPESST